MLSKRFCKHLLSIRRGSAAFTLPELATTMAIIAVLASIMLPSAQRAREAAKRAVCLAHIRSIASTSRVYEADDPNGWGIPVHPGQYTQNPSNPTFVGAYEWGGKSGVGWNDWLSGSPGDPLNSKYGTKAGFGPATRPMNVLFYPGGFKDNLAVENEMGMLYRLIHKICNIRVDKTT